MKSIFIFASYPVYVIFIMSNLFTLCKMHLNILAFISLFQMFVISIDINSGKSWPMRNFLYVIYKVRKTGNMSKGLYWRAFLPHYFLSMFIDFLIPFYYVSKVNKLFR